jgi:hypothetical protein
VFFTVKTPRCLVDLSRPVSPDRGTVAHKHQAFSQRRILQRIVRAADCFVGVIFLAVVDGRAGVQAEVAISAGGLLAA